MNKYSTISKKLMLILLTILMAVCFLFSGCSGSNEKSIINIEKTGSSGLTDIYTITYSNGSKYNFYIENGKDGTNAVSPTIKEIYDEYVRQYGEISYADFLKSYIKGDKIDNSNVINECLQSCLKLYTEFAVTSVSGWGPYQTSSKNIAISCGSGIVYKIESDFVYVLTNYHVVYNTQANEDNNGKIARKIHGYLFGSDGSPVNSGKTDNSYPIYDYGDYGIEFTYVGGSVDYDLAILKAKKSDVFKINENVKPVKLAQEYHVGQTAIAIGNPENEGISATEGIVSVDNEYIKLNIDGISRSYRSIRIDTAIYEGSSGGGLFNTFGELIGLTNAGDSNDQNVNYAIPLEIVKNVVENIMINYDGENAGTVKKALLGITVNSSNSKYVYDATVGYGQIKETISISKVVNNSIAETLNLKVGDILVSITVDGTEIMLNRYFEIENAVLQMKTNSTIKIKYKRDSAEQQTSLYIIKASDLK